MHGRVLLLAAAAVAGFAAPAPAAAQVTVPGLGEPSADEASALRRPPGRPSVPGPEAGAGEVRNYRGDASRTGVEPDDAVFGPLEHLWTATPPDGVVNHPLIVGGRLVASITTMASAGYAPGVAVWDLRTRRRLWLRAFGVTHDSHGYTGSAHVAADRERVYAVGRFDGRVRAYSLADGTPLWESRPYERTTSAEPPILAGGHLLWVHEPDGTLFAHDPATGEIRWRALLDLEYGGAIAADAERVYATSICGETVALRLADGAELWRVPHGDCDVGREPTIAVSGGRVVAGLGRVLDALTGAPAGQHPLEQQPAVADGVAFTNHPVPLAADIVTGARRWTRDVGDWLTDPDIAPVVVGPTVYAARRHGIVGLDGATGRVLSELFMPFGPESGTFDQGGLRGMAAGHGVLAVATPAGVAVLTGLLKPQALGTDVAATRFDLVGGQASDLATAVGTRLAGAPVALQADRFPYGRWRTVLRGRPGVDRTFYARVRPSRNTRYRLAAPAAASRPFLTVRAEPRLRLTGRSLGPGRAVVRGTLTGPADLRVAGRRLVLYVGWARRDHADRVAAGTLRRTGRGRFVATFRYRWPRSAGIEDGPLLCVPGLPRLGFGRNGAFERRCGARRVRLRLEPPS